MFNHVEYPMNEKIRRFNKLNTLLILFSNIKRESIIMI